MFVRADGRCGRDGWRLTELIEIVEKNTKLFDRQFPVAVRIRRLEHIFRLLISQRLAEFFHRSLDFLGRDETVGILVKRAKRLAKVGIVRRWTEVLHNATEFIERDRMAMLE